MSQAPLILQQVECTYCKNTAPGPDGRHAQCPGAIRIPGTERVILCKCCTPADGMCTTCGNRTAGEVDVITWYCFDRFACSSRVQARCEQSPLYRMLQDARLDGAVKRRRQKLEIARIQEGLNDEETDSFEDFGRKPRSRTVRPKSGTCLCCGEPTKGGRFRPGHDARYKGQLQRAAASGDTEAAEKLTQHGWAPKALTASA